MHRRIFLNKMVFSILLLFSCNLYAQMISGYYVVSTNNMSDEIKTQLSNKIKVSLSKAGLAVTDGYFPMVTVINYDENEVIEIPGIRKSYKAIGTVSLFILFENNSQLLSASSFDVQGVGNSINIAQSNAIKNIAIPAVEMNDLLTKAKNNYQNAIDEYGIRLLNEAKGHFANKKYELCIEVVNEVPRDCKAYKDVEAFINKVTKQRDKERNEDIELQKRKIEQLEKNRQEMINQKEKDRQERAYQVDKEREHEREMEKIRQGNETKREEFRNRGTIEKVFSNLWNSVTGKKNK